MTHDEFVCLSKRRYGNRMKAEAEIATLARLRRRGSASLYPYRCDVCKEFHLSHQRNRKSVTLYAPPVAA